MKISQLSILLLISSIAFSCVGDRSSRDSESDTAKAFINAIANGYETEASSYLSPSAKDAVLRNCPNGKATNCLDELGRQEWGDLERVFFDLGDPSGALIFTTYWSEGFAFWVVIQVVPQGNDWAVEGWRGFVPASGDFPAGLLEGTNPINAFPPLTQPPVH